MQHLFPSAFRVERLARTSVDGIAVVDYVSQPAPLAFVKGRFDLNFLRPGKDQPPPQEGAGVAPDRYGVLFCAILPIRAGDRLVTIPNEVGAMPIEGTFTVQAIPDYAQDFNSAHHIEVQIVETTQDFRGKLSGSP